MAAVIWQRKKNLLIALITGVVMAAVPLGIILTVEMVDHGRCREELTELEDSQQSRKPITAYGLNCNKSKGDLILESDLIEYSLYSEERLNGLTSKDKLIGKELKIDVEKGTIVDLSMVHEQEKTADDVRLHIYSDIELHSGILEGSVVDIRITFPNGEDYIIAEHKKIIKRIEDSILINVNEEEILKLSSAKVDKSVYEGARTYAIMYAEEYQEAGISDYPVNADVIELGNWDPNLINKVFDEETTSKRNVLESNMNKFMS